MLWATILGGKRRVTARLPVRRVVVTFLLAGALWPTLSLAEGSNSSLRRAPLVAIDWQPPLSLPPSFRNHCRYDGNRGRVYCANHCGIDHEFYYCSPISFGCCHPGYGYCDWRERLRCAS
ncbi:MAG: hypothetical protein ACRECV_14195 [Xanthobacteraceae bacterium]